MSSHHHRFVTACQQMLVLGVVCAALTPAANVLSLDLVPALLVHGKELRWVRAAIWSPSRIVRLPGTRVLKPVLASAV